MTQATMTKRGNIRLNGEKFYAVRQRSCAGCVLEGHPDCGVDIYCDYDERSNTDYRLRRQPVIFVSREAYLVKGKPNAS